MPARDGIALAPADEQQIGGKGSLLLSAGVTHDLYAVGSAIASFERGWAIVHRHVPTDRIRVALRMVGGKESAHRQRSRRLPTISPNTFPVGKATVGRR